MHAFVTGGAGFVGSHLVDHLLERGDQVTVFDPSIPLQHRLTNYVAGSITDVSSIVEALREYRPDIVYHFAANADVSQGAKHPRRDLELNTLGTLNVLEAMRETDGPKHIVFASSGAVYGDTVQHPTPEIARMEPQTSLYGASKLAAEGLISAYCSTFGFTGTICRLETMSGERYHHGVIADFYRKLIADPTKLEIIGDGSSRKGYLYVGDAVDGVMIAADSAEGNGEPTHIFNVGSSQSFSVDGVASLVASMLGVSPKPSYTGSSWAGDAREILLDCHKLDALGWYPRVTPAEGIVRTVRYLMDHPETVEPWS